MPAEQTSAKSKDGAIKIVSQADGLHITKRHAAKFIYVTIHVRSDDGECVSIYTNEKTNTFVYPFTTAGKTYAVYLTMMDKNWGNYTTSKEASVTATGGIGECKIRFSSYAYDKRSLSIVLSDFVLTQPPEISSCIKRYEGNVYYDVANGINWGASRWGIYHSTVADGRNYIDISPNASYFMNKKFFIQLNYLFTYNGVTYQASLISNEKDMFTDAHPVTSLSLSSGVLLPSFSPKVFSYTVTGTDKPVTITPVTVAPQDANGTSSELQNKPGASTVMNFLCDDEQYSYTFTYGNNEVRTFDGCEYIETFADDFDGTELDYAKWHRCNQEERQGTMKNHGWWSDSCSYVADGSLVIDNRQLDGIFFSGAIETAGVFEQAHGLYEVKFKCENTSGLWYAFWLLGDNDDKHIGNGAKDAAEIDIWELVPKEPNDGPNHFKTTIHWDGYGAAHKSKSSPLYSPNDDFYNVWHVAQFVWGKDSYKLFLDGVLLYELPAKDFGGMCEGKAHIIISSEFGDWGGPIDERLLPAKMYVDYVKVYAEK